jgi:D-tyrosyl-tRNA(Tyr) deacylase
MKRIPQGNSHNLWEVTAEVVHNAPNAVNHKMVQNEPL